MHALRTGRLTALAILFAYLAASAALASGVPPWEAPDEPWHLAYAEALASGRTPGAEDTYEFHQPPLYYLYLGAVMRAAGIPTTPRPPANPRYPLAAAAYWHAPGDPAVPALRLLRLATSWLGLLAVAFTWAAARVAVPRDRNAAAGAAVALALLPQFTFISGSISNDPLVSACGGAWLYGVCLAWRRASTGRWPWLAVAVVIAALVAGLLTKLTILGLFPATLLVLVAMARRSNRPAAAVASLAALGAATVFVALIYQRWSPATLDALTGRVGALGPGAGGRNLHSLAEIASALPMVLRSIWAQFGWRNVPGPAPFAIVAAASAAIVLWRLAARYRDLETDQREMLSWALAGVVGMMAAFYVNLRVDLQPQGRLLFAGLPAAALVLAVGNATVRRKQPMRSRSNEASRETSSPDDPLRAARREFAGPPNPRAERRAKMSGPSAVLAVAGALTIVVSLGQVLPAAYAAASGPPPHVLSRFIAAPAELRPVEVQLWEGEASLALKFEHPSEDWARVEVPLSGLQPGARLVMTATTGSTILGISSITLIATESVADWPSVDLGGRAIQPDSERDQPLVIEISVSRPDAGLPWLGRRSRPIHAWATGDQSGQARLIVDGRDVGGAVAVVYGR